MVEVVTISTYELYYKCPVFFVFFYYFDIVYIDLVVMLLLINLPLYYFTIVHTKKCFFPQDFNLLFQTNCKNCKKRFM